MDNLSAVESIFFAALDKASPEERAAYLEEACGTDQELRRCVERLLSAQPRVGSFLQGRAPGLPATVDESPLTERPGTRIGPYKLLEQIGEGGMGVVYMAEQEQPVRRRVALKIIKPGMDSAQVIARFEAERQALALMDHPNIAKVLDAGTTESGRPYFVMELVHGVPVTKYCDDNHLNPCERLELFVPVCRAIQHAHQKGIIHRDVKPSNVLVCLYDGKPVPKVIDFGVAKATQQRLTERTLFTQFGAMVGTLEYMSPEQAERSQLGVDTRSDVYSLGVLLYELLTGTTPLEKQRLREVAFDEVLRLIREEEPPRPSTRLSSSGPALVAISAQRRTEPARLAKLVRGELDWIVMKALEKDRARRYDSASGLARDIERYLHDETVEACPPSTVYRLRKFARKNRKLLLTAAALVATLLLGVLDTAWQALRARRAEAEALAQRNAAVVKEQEAQEERNQAAGANARLTRVMHDLRRTLYAAHMNLAQKAWDTPAGMAMARGLLDQQRPGSGEADLRGFEWHYLNRLCHTELLTLAGHTRAIHRMALAGDGRRLATDSGDGTVRVWDLQTGQQILSCKGKQGFLETLGFSHDDRGLVVIEGLRPGWSIGVLDAQTGKEIWMHQVNFKWGLGHALSPDRRRLATYGMDDTVKVWNLETGEESLTLGEHASRVTALAFSPDGLRLATASDDKTVRLWDAHTARELLTLKGHGKPVTSMAFSADGHRLASGSIDRTAKVWDVQHGGELFTLTGHDDTVFRVAFSPDGRLLGTSSGAVKVWDAQTGRAKYTLCESPEWVSTWNFSPDSRRLLSGDTNRTIRVWDAQTGQEVLRHRGHADRLEDVRFSPDGRRILSAAADGVVKVWDAEKSPEPVCIRRFRGKISAVAFHAGRIAVAHNIPPAKSDDWSKGEVQITDVRTGQEILTLKADDRGVWNVAFSPDGQRLASIGTDLTLKAWEVQTGREIFTLEGRKEAHQGGVFIGGEVAYSPDGRHLASASSDEKVTVRDARTGRETLAVRTKEVADTLAYSPDGLRLAGGCSKSVKVWDTRTGQEAFTITSPPGQVQSVAFTPDGHYLVGGADRDTIRFWDASTGREVRTLRGHSGSVVQLAFSPDGRRLASASADHTVKLWDPATGHELWTFTGPEAFTSVAFSPDGTQLAGACGNEVRIWDATPLPQGQPTKADSR
jgi:WD40 repeat protein/serine/threonine protein kinase